MMSNRCGTPLLIDPEEIVNLSRRFASLGSVYAAKAVCEAWWKKNEDTDYNRLWLLGVIFEAGRVHGIREERKRRACHTNKTDGGNWHE